MEIRSVSLMTLGLAVALVLAAPASAQTRDPKADVAAILGRFTLVSGEKGGQPLPSDRVKDVTVRIDDDVITTFDKDENEVYVATYVLDTGKQPWRITMTTKRAPDGEPGTKADGLIARDGDTVKLIYALPGGLPPTDFKTQAKQQMFLLKNTSK